MLEKYLVAHEKAYKQALAEIRNGCKESHWMWFIFPQIAGLGFSEISRYYGINSIHEASAYMENDTLKDHMLEICQALLELESNDAMEVFGWPDNLKLQSSMTLFSVSCPQFDIFNKVLGKFFAGELDAKTLELIKR